MAQVIRNEDPNELPEENVGVSPTDAAPPDEADMRESDGVVDEVPKSVRARQQLAEKGPAAKIRPPSGHRFFAIYKRGQGKWTRLGTLAGSAIVGAMLAYSIYSSVPTFLPQNADRAAMNSDIALISMFVFIAIFCGLYWWMTNKPSNVDFLIATDSEMKKVNWTTRKELIGSTKVVIGFVIITALFLFGCDIFFSYIMEKIHVLNTGVL